MDRNLEAQRIPTKFRHGFVPLKETPFVALPDSVSKRNAGWLSMHLLEALGVCPDTLAESEDARQAYETHTDSTPPRGFMRESEKAQKGGKLKAAYEAAQTDLSNNTTTLERRFGKGNVALAKAIVNKALAQYVIAANS